MCVGSVSVVSVAIARGAPRPPAEHAVTAELSEYFSRNYATNYRFKNLYYYKLSLLRIHLKNILSNFIFV